jgi:hypothetical protein
MKRILDVFELEELPNDILYKLLINADYKFVRDLEKTSKYYKDFISNNKIWKKLFERDYPATSKLFNQKYNEYLIELNYASLNDSDPWKRYYELMKLDLEKYNWYIRRSNPFVIDEEAEFYYSNDPENLFYIKFGNLIHRAYYDEERDLMIDRFRGQANLGEKIANRENFKSLNGFSRFKLYQGDLWEEIWEYKIESRVLVSYGVY